MSVSGILTALQGRLALATGFTSAQVSIHDYRVLSAGYLRAVVLTPIAIESEQMTFRQLLDVHTIDIEYYHQWRGEQNNTDLYTGVENLLTVLRQWPGLNALSGTLVAEITNVSEPEDMTVGRTAYKRTILSCRVREVVTPTRSEQ